MGASGFELRFGISVVVVGMLFLLKIGRRITLVGVSEFRLRFVVVVVVGILFLL